MNYVIKIKYEDTLRRLTYSGSKPHGEQVGLKLTYAELEAKIKDIFKLPAGSQLRVTYTDKDNDVVTMGDDQDLEDACVLQGINPLRLNVTLVEGKNIGRAGSHIEQIARVQLNKTLSSIRHIQKAATDVVKPVAGAKDSFTTRQLSELVDTIVNTVTSQINSAARSGELASASIVATEVEDSAEAETRHVPPPVKKGGLKAIVPIGHRDVADTESLDADHASRVFHSGVQCDICGMSPIVGPRFKSIKKEDYDLCLGCFMESGTASDYNRIDRPLYRVRHYSSGGNTKLRCPAFNPNFHAGRPFSMRGPYGGRPDSRCHSIHQMNGCGGKLDARFVQDVTIFDGTELAPRTNFTKIWRLRNSGTLPWPVDTKLVHVGGDELGCVFVVPLELPKRGLPPGEEVEASVDLVAPEKPGRYVSHWRLASPSGPKFGHRVWVLIQVNSKEELEQGVSLTERSEGPPATVDSSTPEARPPTLRGEMIGNNLFLAKDYPTGLSSLLNDSDLRAVGIVKEASVVEPAVVADEEASDEEGRGEVQVGTIEDVKDEILSETSLMSSNSIGKVLVDDAPETLDDSVSIKSSNSMGKGKSVDDVPATFVNSELGGFVMTEKPRSEENSFVSNPSGSPGIGDASSSTVDVDFEEEAEEFNNNESKIASLSDKLEGMGFSDRKLNLELLEKNQLDLRSTLEDLFAAAGWDPILEELEEMGFLDVEMNRRLMFKNNGSVKRVVKELIQMYKEPAVGGNGLSASR